MLSRLGGKFHRPDHEKHVLIFWVYVNNDQFKITCSVSFGYIENLWRKFYFSINKTLKFICAGYPCAVFVCTKARPGGVVINLVADFQAKLREELGARNLALATWQGGARRSQHLLEIDTIPNPTVLYAKESNSSPGFWGLTRNQIDRLNKTQLLWFAVLLLKSSDFGYVLTRDEVNNFILDGTFELSRDGDYKVNERTDLVSAKFHRGIENLLSVFLDMDD